MIFGRDVPVPPQTIVTNKPKTRDKMADGKASEKSEQ